LAIAVRQLMFVNQSSPINFNGGIMSYFRSTAGRVLSCVLYLIAGMVTGGLMVMYMRLQTSLGSGSPPVTMYISLFGSLVLVIAAVSATFRFRGAGYIALTGVISVWIFYLAMVLPSVTQPGMMRTDAALLLVLVGSLAYPVAAILGARKASVGASHTN
jgi:hypothetical protein